MSKQLSPLLALALASCATAGPAAPSRPVVFGITQPVGGQADFDAAASLTAYLQKRIDPASAVRVFADADQLGAALANGEIDAAWTTPGAYVRAKSKNAGIHAVLKISRSGATSYRSVFIALKKSGGTIQAFIGKRLALGAPGSASGRIYPLAHLKKMGIDSHTYFSEVIDAKDHAEVCRLVASGKADLGATLADDTGTEFLEMDGCREAGIDTKTLQVVSSSGQVPNDVIAVRAGLDKLTGRRIWTAFVEMPNDSLGRPTMLKAFHADGFEPSSDEDFDSVRQMEEIAGP